MPYGFRGKKKSNILKHTNDAETLQITMGIRGKTTSKNGVMFLAYKTLFHILLLFQQGQCC